MDENPDVSVVMGVYNGADHLSETIDSILNQQNVVLELVVVNDGSTDDSEALLRSYEDQDARVRVIGQRNQGLTRALITGCAAARGKYIARQDSGDISNRNRLEVQQLALDEDPSVAFVSCWTEFCGPQLEHLYLVKGTGAATIARQVLSAAEKYGVIDGPSHHGSVMFRRDIYEAAGGYRAEFYYGQDWDLWYRLAQLGKFQMIDQPLYRARLIPSSISAYSKQQQASLARLSTGALLNRLQGLSEQHILDEAGRIRPSGGKKKSAKHEAEWLYFIGECLRKNRDRRSIAYFAQSIRTHPLRLGSWLRLVQLALRFRY